MSIRKVSDLPGLNPDSDEFEIERFRQSLLEVSYVDPFEDDENPHTYKSMYMKGQALADAVLSASGADSMSKVVLRVWNDAEGD